MVDTYVSPDLLAEEPRRARRASRGKWSPRRTLLFVTSTSAGLWAGMIAAVTAVST